VKKSKQILMTIIFVMCVSVIKAETLFEIKDSANNKVLDVSTDGLRVMNEGDTLMVISADAIRANIGTTQKGLSRSFSVTTTSSVKGKGLINALEVDSKSATMTSPQGQYTDFSPENIFIGLNSGTNTTPGSPNEYSGKTNVFFGNESGMNNSSGGYNIMIGDKSGFNNTTGGNNLFIGNNSGETNSTGGWNLFIGHGSGNKNTATNNMFLGHNSGYSNNSGTSNLFVGTDAGAYNTAGSGNVFVGQQTGIYNNNGDNNTFVGRWSGNNNQNYSDDNTMVGFSAGSSQTAGNQNTYIGSLSGKEKTSGYYNTFLGYGSGQKNGTGTSNTMIGYMSGWNNIGSGNVFLGMQAGYNETTGSNKLYIDNSDTSTPLIYGDFSSNALTVNGTLTSTGNAAFNSYTGMGTAPNSNYRLYAVDDYIGVRTYVANSAGSYTYGVYGEARNATTANYGLYGYAYATSGGQNVGVYGYGGGAGPCFAGYFNGNVYVTGTITANDYIEFKSDHPTDPENKYLSHSAVSSDEVKNIYDGVAVLNSQGSSVVNLPDWFEAYNTNFRYQLTAIGKPCPNIYISKKINGGIFEISGGEPGAEISWQVTGVRNDSYAKKNPIQVVEVKTGIDKGLYVNPESYGMQEQKGISFIHNQEIKK